MKTTYMMAILLICWLPGCSRTATIPAPTQTGGEIAPEVDAEIDKLLDLIRIRLLLMRDVAIWKWHEELPIADAERERIVVERSVELARENGLDEKLAEQFIAAQIEAGKEAQREYFADWKSLGAAEKNEALDLARELRPKIDQISSEMINSLSRLAPHLDDENVQRVLRERAGRLSTDYPLNIRACSIAVRPLDQK